MIGSSASIVGSGSGPGVTPDTPVVSFGANVFVVAALGILSSLCAGRGYCARIDTVSSRMVVGGGSLRSRLVLGRRVAGVL